MTELANIHGTDGGSVTEALPELNPAANFDLYRRRQELIAKRNATDDPVKREQIGILIEQLTTFDRATGMQRLALAPAIERQMNLINQRS